MVFRDHYYRASNSQGAIINFPLTWDLDRVFSELEILLSKVTFKKVIPLSEDIQATLKEMEAFVECLIAQNVTDTKTPALAGQVRQLFTRYSNLELTLDALLGELSENTFNQLIKTFPELNFHLHEKRSTYRLVRLKINDLIPIDPFEKRDLIRFMGLF